MSTYVSWRNFLTVIVIILSLVFGVGAYALSENQKYSDLQFSTLSEKIDLIYKDIQDIKGYIFK